MHVDEESLMVCGGNGSRGFGLEIKKVSRKKD